MAYKGAFHLFGFKSAIRLMKASLDGLLADEVEGVEFITTSFKRRDNYLIQFTLEKIVERIMGSGMVPSFTMKMEWKSSDAFHLPNVYDAFSLALGMYLQTEDNYFMMAYSEENVEYMFKKMKMALEAELCLGCETNIVPLGCMECHTCIMGYTEQDDSKHMCGVCHDTCQAKMEVTPCCVQYIHRVCRKKWHGSCPFCRCEH